MTGGYKLPKSLRESLRSPIGRLFIGEPREVAIETVGFITSRSPPLVISVGDFCTASLFNVNFLPNVVIYDGKTLRSDTVTLDLALYKELVLRNPAEWILNEAIDIIKNAISFSSRSKIRVCVRVSGEEDLLTIPCILWSPLGSMVLYGQPPIENREAGIVVVTITPSSKDRITALLDQFEYYNEYRG
ncbi:MAG: GTP-dependent dephospho-CoA kinase family protein [Candidatus Heimdallarchaeota archaeon]